MTILIIPALLLQYKIYQKKKKKIEIAFVWRACTTSDNPSGSGVFYMYGLDNSAVWSSKQFLPGNKTNKLLLH